MQKYDTGDVVKITFTAVVTNNDGLTASEDLKPESYLLVKDKGAGFHHALFNNSIGRGIEVELVEKANPLWPPRENDVWRTSVRTYHFVGGKFRVLTGSGLGSLTKEEAKDKTGLRLVYRNFETS